MCVCAVTACDTTASLRSLRQTDLSEDTFLMHLARQYLKFADAEAKNYDWWSSKYFADKGLTITYGHDVSPEHVDNWRVAENNVLELETARETLMNALTPELKKNNPSRAAEMQFNFDCWLEQQEEAWQEDDINACKNQFYAMIEKNEEEQVAQQEPPMEPMGGPLSYLLYFPWDSNDLDEMGEDGLVGITQELLSTKRHYDIIINGHADSSGSDEYNMELSRKRAEYIRRFLVDHGIPEDRITYYAFGESDPQVPTANGVRERANRRAEIFIE